MKVDGPATCSTIIRKSCRKDSVAESPTYTAGLLVSYFGQEDPKVSREVYVEMAGSKRKLKKANLQRKAIRNMN